MDWVCLSDRSLLGRLDDGWRCPTCGRHYRTHGEIPIFARDDGRTSRVTRQVPQLDDLWASMSGRTADEAAALFCKRHGYTRAPYATDWKLFFAPRPEGVTLEIGAGFGDDTVELATGPGRVIAAVPTLVNARIVGKRLQERVAAHASVIAIDDLSRLPLPDRSVDAIAMEDAAAPAFGLTARSLPAVAAEWKRVLKPDGSVFVGAANPVLGLPGARPLIRTLRTGPRAESMNRAVKRLGGTGGRGPGPGRTVRELTGLGFLRPAAHAPLPDENDAQVVIPVDDARAVRYFLHNLIRKNSATVRLAVGVADLLVTLNLFRHVVPYYYLVFRSDAGHASRTVAAP